jgi:hypothetical protein
MDVTWFQGADPAGAFTTTLDLSSWSSPGMRLGLQAAWIDGNRPGLPLSFANGLLLVLDDIGVGANCTTVFFPAGATISPWTPFHGQMPVLGLDH